MEKIIAERATWLKKSPEQADALPDAEKRAVIPGDVFNVEEYKDVGNGHWLVVFSNGTEWYIFDAALSGEKSHWSLSWQEDDQESNDIGNLAQPDPSLLSDDEPVGINLKPDDPFDTKITPHFTYGEICCGEEARRFQSPASCQTAYELCKFLEQVREAFGGKAIKITSGHRPPEVNAAVGGATQSEHLFQYPGVGAIDFCVIGADMFAVQSWCDEHWPHSIGYGAPLFVHVGKGRGYKRWNY